MKRKRKHYTMAEMVALVMKRRGIGELVMYKAEDVLREVRRQFAGGRLNHPLLVGQMNVKIYKALDRSRLFVGMTIPRLIFDTTSQHIVVRPVRGWRLLGAGRGEQKVVKAVCCEVCAAASQASGWGAYMCVRGWSNPRYEAGTVEATDVCPGAVDFLPRNGKTGLDI